MTVIGHITPNLDRILDTEEPDMCRLVGADLTVLLLKVHRKYSFGRETPEECSVKDRLRERGRCLA